jgi:hypothetical protein
METMGEDQIARMIIVEMIIGAQGMTIVRTGTMAVTGIIMIATGRTHPDILTTTGETVFTTIIPSR